MYLNIYYNIVCYFLNALNIFLGKKLFFFFLNWNKPYNVSHMPRDAMNISFGVMSRLSSEHLNFYMRGNFLYFPYAICFYLIGFLALNRSKSLKQREKNIWLHETFHHISSSFY